MPAQLAASRAGALKSGSSSDHRSYQRVEAALQALGTDGAMPGGGGRSGEQPGGHDHAEFLVAAEVADFEPVAVVDQRRDPARSGQPAIEAVLVRGIVLEEQALLVPYLPGACVAPVGAALVQEQGRRPRRAGGGPRPRDLRGVGDPALVARLGDRAAGLVARSVAAEPRRRVPDRRRGHLPRGRPGRLHVTIVRTPEAAVATETVAGCPLDLTIAFDRFGLALATELPYGGLSWL